MNSPSGQFVNSRRMAAYEPMHQIDMWAENLKNNSNFNTSASIIMEAEAKPNNQSEDFSNGMLGSSEKSEQETNKSFDKVQRRLAQNREAARKSRLRKKVYVQQLETSRLKLMQIEQELERVRQQGICMGGGLDANNHLGFSGTMSSDSAAIATFEMEYGHWVEEQCKQTCELRAALRDEASDIELQILVNGGMSHYFELFRMKATAVKADVFYVISGMWKTSAEKFLLWIGGFRPSELLKVLTPHLEPLAEQQCFDVCNLKQSCQQAEEALTQGINKLQQMVAETVATDQLGEVSYVPPLVTPHMGIALERLKALVNFVNQADHLRRETLQQMHRILTIRQAARGFLALGEYFQRLRALSSLWATCPHELT